MSLRLKARLGKRIKELRKRQRLTQDRLGESAGISAKYLSSIERGRENPTLDTLLRLAAQLQVEPQELFLFGPQTAVREVVHKELEGTLARADTERLHAILTLLKTPAARER